MIVRIYSKVLIITKLLLITVLLLLPVKISPASSTNVSLHYELIKLKLVNKNRVEVCVHYYYRGDLSIVKKMAFPETEWFKLRDFSAYRGGKKLNVKYIMAPENHTFLIGGHEYTGVYSYEIPVHLRTRRNSVTKYWFQPPYFGPGTKGDEPVGLYVEYILMTGATWEGAIGRFDVEFDTGDVPCNSIRHLKDSYTGVCKPDGKWHYKAFGVEPDKNIRLLLPL